MDRVFNMGIGMIVVVDEADAASIAESAAGQEMEAWRIGTIVEGEGVRYR
jgi:phosphoribosylaminoimidazole (AIR) synthetase